jgi:hypothetical protein
VDLNYQAGKRKRKPSNKDERNLHENRNTENDKVKINRRNRGKETERRCVDQKMSFKKTWVSLLNSQLKRRRKSYFNGLWTSWAKNKDLECGPSGSLNSEPDQFFRHFNFQSKNAFSWQSVQLARSLIIVWPSKTFKNIQKYSKLKHPQLVILH